jgi:hypothetical protein
MLGKNPKMISVFPEISGVRATFHLHLNKLLRALYIKTEQINIKLRSRGPVSVRPRGTPQKLGIAVSLYYKSHGAN